MLTSWPPHLTERARRVLGFAHDLSDRRGDAHVTSSHVMLGLLQEAQNVAVHVLVTHGVPLDALAAALTASLPVPGTPRALPIARGWSSAYEHLVANARRESREMNTRFSGCEHLLLAILRDREEIAAKVLARYGIEFENVQAEVRRVLAS